MAITHADLEIRRRSRDLGSKAGTAVIVLCVLCGLLGFVFCVLAESSRSEATWELVSTENRRTAVKCVYSGSGEVALLYGAGGFVTLAVAMLVQHTYIWLAVNKKKTQSTPTSGGNFSSPHSFFSLFSKGASIVFLLAWVCFAAAEVLLLIGIAVESIHSKKGWREPRDGCVVVRRWTFLAAGVFDLTTVIFATSFYLLILKMKRQREDELAIGNEVAEADRFSANAAVLRPPTTASSSVPVQNPNVREVEGLSPKTVLDPR